MERSPEDARRAGLQDDEHAVLDVRGVQRAERGDVARVDLVDDGGVRLLALDLVVRTAGRGAKRSGGGVLVNAS